MEPHHDGFARLADALAQQAGRESDPATIARLLEKAARLRGIDRKAREVEAFVPPHVAGTGNPTVQRGVIAFLFASLWGLAILRGDIEAFAVVLVLSVFLAWGVYLDSRDLTSPPSRTERVLAWSWRIFRGAVGIAAFGVLAIAPVALRDRIAVHANATALTAGIAIGIICLWIGVFGYRRSVGKARRVRYGWRF